LGLWGLSSPVVEAIALHHKPTRGTLPGLTPLLVLCVGDALANGRRVLEPARGEADPLFEAFSRRGLANRWPAWQRAWDSVLSNRE